ncbi:response regulator [Dongshaea marina]|uniref:response regulator n=1 Tax=Dongshaea marina TaxID=2047966 RepID=UPI000D3E1839|nr:response regulator [Dongshaea marina]
MKILIVEDDQLLAHHLSSVLSEQGHQTLTTDRSKEALYYASEYPIDIAIIDLGLPDSDGISLIKKLRAQKISFPILILTARSNWQDKVDGLEAGADDYMVKPFQHEELKARMNALLRRSSGFVSPKVTADPYTLDLSSKTLLMNEDTITLTSFEYSILEYLMRNSKQVVSKQQLLDQLYGDNEGDPNTIEVMMSRLRKKIDPQGTIHPISTIRRQGYIFNLSCS